MPQPVISVENLSKAYRIGAKEEVPDTLARCDERNLQFSVEEFSTTKKS